MEEALELSNLVQEIFYMCYIDVESVFNACYVDPKPVFEATYYDIFEGG